MKMAHLCKVKSLSSSHDHRYRTPLEAALVWLRSPEGPGLRWAAGTSCWCWPYWHTQCPQPAGRPCCWCWSKHPDHCQSSTFHLSHTDLLETLGELREGHRAPWRCPRSLSDEVDVLWLQSSWQTGSVPGCLSQSCWLSLRRQHSAGWTASPGWSAHSPEKKKKQDTKSNQGHGTDAEHSKNTAQIQNQGCGNHHGIYYYIVT